MPSVADLIIASASDAPAIVASDYALGTYRGIKLDGVDPPKLAALHSLLGGGDVATLMAQYYPVAEGSSAGPWLVPFPAELIALLGKIDPQKEASVAEGWASTDSVRQDGWSADVAQQFLSRVTTFARNAAYDHRELYLLVYR